MTGPVEMAPDGAAAETDGFVQRCAPASSCGCSCHRMPVVSHVAPCCGRTYELDADVRPVVGSPAHPYGSVVEQVHRVWTTDQGVDAWALAEETVRFVRERLAREAESVSSPAQVDGERWVEYSLVRDCDGHRYPPPSTGYSRCAPEPIVGEDHVEQREVSATAWRRAGASS